VEEQLTLREYGIILFRRKKVFLAFFLGLTFIVTAASILMPPLYRGETTLLVEKAEEEPLVPVKRVISDFVDRVSLITTQVEIISSRRVLEKVIRDFSLDRKLRIWGGHKFEKAVLFLRKSVKVVPIKNTDFIRIRLDLRDKALVAPVVNAIAKYYIECYYEIRGVQSNAVIDFIDAQIEIVKAKLNDAEVALKEYEETNGIISLGDESKVYAEKSVDEERRQVELLENYADDHPDVIASRKKIEGIFRPKIRDLPRKRLEVKRLEYGVQNLRDIYLMLLKKREEMRIALEMERTRLGQVRNIKVIDPAVEPIKHVWPKRKINVLLAIVMGLVGGVGLAFGVDHLDHSLHSRTDVKRYLGLSVVGSAPLSPAVASLAASGDPGTVEQYRDLWNTVTTFSPSARKILVTSASDGEGKTTTALNLALALGRDGTRRVLLVGADDRGVRPENLLGIEAAAGLTDLLEGKRDLKGLLKVVRPPSLSFIPLGVKGASASALDLDRLKDLIGKFGEEFDCVIVDSGSSALRSATLAIVPAFDYVLFVVRAGSTRREVAAQALERLAAAKMKGIGVMLNGQRYDVPEDLYRTI